MCGDVWLLCYYFVIALVLGDYVWEIIVWLLCKLVCDYCVIIMWLFRDYFVIIMWLLCNCVIIMLLLC